VDYLIGHTEIDRVIEPVQSYDLNTDEADLVNTYRKLCKPEKESIRLVMRNYTEKE